MAIPVPIDLETTGLDASVHAILEFSMLLVTPDLELIGDFGSRVLHATDEQLGDMDDYVTDMHSRTGLLDEVRASTLSVDDVDAEAADWLTAQGLIEPRGGIILGSSCRMDLEFIERQMPKLASKLTYRMIDVSGMTEALQMWEPTLVPELPYELAARENWVSHRAASDIRWSLEGARGIKKNLSLLIPG